MLFGQKIKTGQLESIVQDYNFRDIEVYGVFPPGAANTKKPRLLINCLKEYIINQALNDSYL